MPESHSKWLVQLTVQQLTGMTLMAPFSPTQRIMHTPFANNKCVNNTDCVFRGSGVCVHTCGVHVCAKDELSVFVRVRVGFVSGSIYRRPATFTPTMLDSTCQYHPFTTPPGVFWAGSWTVPPSWPPVATVYHAVYLAHPDGHFYGQGAQQSLIPGLSGVDLANWTICTHF